jgi:hypothetical protein
VLNIGREVDEPDQMTVRLRDEKGAPRFGKKRFDDRLRQRFLRLARKRRPYAINGVGIQEHLRAEQRNAKRV